MVRVPEWGVTLLFQLPPQAAVQGRQGFVQQDGPGPGGQYPGQSDPLLLSAALDGSEPAGVGRPGRRGADLGVPAAGGYFVTEGMRRKIRCIQRQ